jgi:hypothetical protein
MLLVGAQLAGCLLLIGLGGGLLVGGPGRSEAGAFAVLIALLLLAVGSIGQLNWAHLGHVGRVVAIGVLALNGLMVLAFLYMLFNVTVFQFYWVDYGPSANLKGAEAVREAWEFLGLVVLVWGVVNGIIAVGLALVPPGRKPFPQP